MQESPDDRMDNKFPGESRLISVPGHLDDRFVLIRREPQLVTIKRISTDSKFSCEPRFRSTGRRTLSMLRASCDGQYRFPASVLPCPLCYWRSPHADEGGRH